MMPLGKKIMTKMRSVPNTMREISAPINVTMSW